MIVQTNLKPQSTHGLGLTKDTINFNRVGFQMNSKNQARVQVLNPVKIAEQLHTENDRSKWTAKKRIGEVCV